MAEWVTAFDPAVLGSNPAAATSLRNFGNSVGGDTKNRRSLLSGVYARRSKISHTGDRCVTCR